MKPKTHFPAVLAATCIFIYTGMNLHAQDTGFGGPDRNGIYPDTDLLDEWPAEGPELIATITGIGDGYGSPAVNEKGIWIAGMLDTIGWVFHFNHDHQLMWKHKIGPEFNFKYVGSRGTPTIVDNHLYYVASMGDAVCLDANTGQEHWRINIMERFNGPDIKWGYTESPLVYGDKVYFTPGGPHQNLVALDKLTGEVIWKADIDSTYNAYCSPVIIHHEGEDRMLLNTSDFLLLVDPETGELQVKYPLTNDRGNHPIAPLYKDGKLFYSSGYGEGTTLFDIDLENRTLDTIYYNPDFDCKLSGLIEYDGTVFGTADKRRLWMGVDFDSGETVFTTRDIKVGSFILSDDKFYIFTDAGEVALAIPSKTGFDIVSRFEVPAGKTSYAFAHPVMYDGTLFIRYNNDLWLYKVD